MASLHKKATVSSDANSGAKSAPPRRSSEVQQEQQPTEHAIVLQSPSSLRLPLHLPPDSFTALRLPAHEILHGRNRAIVCKANGWGFKDTYLCFLDKLTLTLTGSR
ncbi:hypothetical protein cyc_04016 [Cyclospora cayetanensis]|uniref:Uncharacterized protein n=1 Tax=Cyclospora cayetanensis TaxID=88456 RepID=A0A1D3D3X7_9EIME|nr:hypothetical protein cyc_04016 [Cyclospora cayetanensis]